MYEIFTAIACCGGVSTRAREANARRVAVMKCFKAFLVFCSTHFFFFQGKKQRQERTMRHYANINMNFTTPKNSPVALSFGMEAPTEDFKDLKFSVSGKNFSFEVSLAGCTPEPSFNKRGYEEIAMVPDARTTVAAAAAVPASMKRPRSFDSLAFPLPSKVFNPKSAIVPWVPMDIDDAPPQEEAQDSCSDASDSEVSHSDASHEAEIVLTDSDNGLDESHSQVKNVSPKKRLRINNFIDCSEVDHILSDPSSSSSVVGEEESVQKKDISDQVQEFVFDNIDEHVEFSSASEGLLNFANSVNISREADDKKFTEMTDAELDSLTLADILDGRHHQKGPLPYRLLAVGSLKHRYFMYLTTAERVVGHFGGGSSKNTVNERVVAKSFGDRKQDWFCAIRFSPSVQTTLQNAFPNHDWQLTQPIYFSKETVSLNQVHRLKVFNCTGRKAANEMAKRANSLSDDENALVEYILELEGLEGLEAPDPVEAPVQLEASVPVESDAAVEEFSPVEASVFMEAPAQVDFLGVNHDSWEELPFTYVPTSEIGFQSPMFPCDY